MQLEFISDAILEKEVLFLLEKARQAKKKSQKELGKNVIDPLSAIFEISGFEIDAKIWQESETARQAQKSLQNHIGTFHQNILGSASGWENMKTGSVVDLVCQSRKIIAEIKNKYNTVSGGQLSKLYDVLDEQVSPKNSIYKDYTAYYVTIIPKKPKRKNEPFVPSDKEKGRRRERNEMIREIDGVSFYDLVFETEHALKQIYMRLPIIISSLFEKSKVGKQVSKECVKVLNFYFSEAFPD